MAGFSRYVAIGDSQTEGLWDGDDSTGLRGFADRLAETIDSHYPGLRYANLAVRGRLIADVLWDQLPQALSMNPDLITMCIGMNDATRPGGTFGTALADLDRIHARLAASGATVVTTTFPDITKILPAGRLLEPRLRRINEAIVDAAGTYGFRLVDLFGAESMTVPATWSDDRVHGSSRGHALFAAAAAEVLGLPGSNHDWAVAAGDSGRPSLRAQARSQALWTRNMLIPWAWDHVRGRSTGDGRSPKRPTLEPVDRASEEGDRRQRAGCDDPVADR